jgi:hypothetical protein
MFAHTIAAMTIDHCDPFRAKRPRRIDDMSQQRLLRQWMKHFGQRGFHPRTLTGSENDHT